MVAGRWRNLYLYVLIVSFSSEAASRLLLERDHGQKYGALVKPARRLSAESTQPNSLSDKRGAEEAALLALHGALAEADAAKLRWQPGTDHCKWPGVYCTDDKYVYLIDLSRQGIAGTLSDAVDLSALQELQSIWLQGNQLAGSLPASWFSLPSLRELLLYDNAIEGTLPAEALAATSGLRRLNLNGNKLTGALPTAVSALSSLEALHLANNGFEGTVPAAFADLSKLKTLALYNNPQLSGCIPAALQSKERPMRLETDDSQPAAAAPDPALANTQVCGFCSSTCTDTGTAAAAASPSPDDVAGSSSSSPSPASSPDTRVESSSTSPAVVGDASSEPASPSPVPSPAAEPAADPNASARTNPPDANTQAAAGGAAASDAASPAPAGDAAAAAAGTAAGTAAPAPEQPAILPLNGAGTTTTAPAAGGAAAGSPPSQDGAVGPAIVIPDTSSPDPGSKHVKVDPNLTVLEDDVQGKAQVYMEFEGHPSYVAATANHARRKRVLM